MRAVSSASLLRGLGLATLLALAACGGAKKDDQANLDSLDNELTADNTTDPALTASLHDQIMVDPTLTQQANNDAIRPPVKPVSAGVPPEDVAAADAGQSATTGASTSEKLKSAPAATSDCPQCKAARTSLTLGALAQNGARVGGQCVGGLQYSAQWASRLPAALPLYPDARLSEAAGADGNGCSLRAVSFSTAAGFQDVLDYYYTHASNAGYDAQHETDGGQHVLGGTSRNGGAFTLFVTPRRDGGSDVDLVANQGR
jgi:hypothetical protein